MPTIPFANRKMAMIAAMTSAIAAASSIRVKAGLSGACYLRAYQKTGRPIA